MVINELKTNKAAGLDGVTSQMIANMGDLMENKLLELFNYIWISGILPESWKQGEVVLINKKPPLSKISHYRPITLISVTSKLLTKIVSKRLSQVIESSNLIADNQNGFRKKRSCSDNLFILNTIIDANRASNKSTYLFFVDLKEAYDMIDRPILLGTLKEMNFPNRFLNFLKDYYEGDNITSGSGRIYTKPQFQQRGLPQGCNLSSILFILYLVSLSKKLNEKKIGIQLSGLIISHLLFADDVIVFANNKTDLEQLKEALEEWCERHKMKISPEKSQIITPDDSEIWILKDKEINQEHILKIVESYPYLGVTQYDSAKMTVYKKSKLAKTKLENFRKLINLQKQFVPDTVSAFLTIWNNVLLPSALYGLDVIPLTNKQIEELDLEQRKVGKTLLGVPQSTANVSVETLLGVKRIILQIALSRLHIIKKAKEANEDSP